MSLFKKLKAGLNEALEYEKGNKKAAAKVRVVKVKIDQVKETPEKKKIKSNSEQFVKVL